MDWLMCYSRVSDQRLHKLGRHHCNIGQFFCLHVIVVVVIVDDVDDVADVVAITKDAPALLSL